MDIKTKHISNASGRGQVKATGAGRQRTVSWDHSKSNDWNHGNAAGTLALVLGLRWSDDIIHSGGSERGHIFRFPLS